MNEPNGTFREILAKRFPKPFFQHCGQGRIITEEDLLPQELFYNVPIVVILLASIGLFILATEAGFLLGRRSQSAVDEPSQSQIFAIQGAILGLLALLLGFAYAMATFRYDTRRQFLLEEANVIDKTFLRAQLLPEPPREEVSNLLRRYVELRLEAGNSAKALRKVSEATERLHKRLWLRRGCCG